MSRTFNASNNGLYLSSFTVSASPLTLACWCKLASTSSSGVAMAACGSADVIQNVVFSTSLNKWYVASRNAGTPYSAVGTSSGSTSWTHVAGVFASDSSRKIFVNGVEEGANTTSVSPSLSRLGVGVRIDGGVPAPGGGFVFNGTIAHAAVWQVALDGPQLLSLTRGASPLVVSPAELIFYAPLWGETLPELNLKGAALSSYNTPTKGVSDPVIYPA